MSYVTALKAAGAEVLAEQQFGSYQGDWWAKVAFEGKLYWVHGAFGSCSHCDAFQSEFGYDESDRCEEHRFDYDTPEQKACEACKTSAADYQTRLAEFGRSYLVGNEFTQEEAEKDASEYLSSGDSSKALEFLKANKL
jgi:hypothetical protein